MKLLRLSTFLTITILLGFSVDFFSQTYSSDSNDIGYEGNPDDPNRKVINEDIEKIKQNNLPHKSQILSLLERAFVEHQESYLRQISSARFQQSVGYKKLQNYLQNKKINLNHTSETTTQGFTLSEERGLFVVFDRKPDNNWYVADAYLNAFIMENGQWQERRSELGEQGFTPLEYESNFAGFLKATKGRTIDSYCGLAPYGKLGKNSVNFDQLELSQNKTVKIKNIIIHDGNNGIEDFIFLTLKYYPPGYSEGPYTNLTYKSGWLIEGSGAMSELYKPGEDVYMDYLLGRNRGQLNLNAPNKGLGVVDLSGNRLHSPQPEFK